MLRLLVLLLAAPVLATSDTPPEGVTLILVRHAEAEAEGSDPGLTAEGVARAQCLVGVIGAQPVSHLFASPLARTKQTLAPLAAERKLAVVERDPMKPAELAAEIAALPGGSVAVVAGHSNTIPLLAKALGVELAALVEEQGQPALPRTEHDRVIRMHVTLLEGVARGRGLRESRMACAPPAR